MAALRRIAQPSEELITLEQAKIHLREFSNDFNSVIQSLIPVVRAEAEQRTGRSIGESIYRLTLDAFPENNEAIPLPRPPVVEIVSVKYTDVSGDLITASPASYSVDDADELSAWLLPAYGYGWPTTRDSANAVVIEYIAGYSLEEIPPDCLQWMKMRLATWYEHVSTHGEGVPPSGSVFTDRLLDSATVDGGVG